MKNTEKSQSIPIPGRMPSPPEHLVKQQQAEQESSGLEPGGSTVRDWSLGHMTLAETRENEIPSAATMGDAAGDTGGQTGPAPVLHVPVDHITIDVLEYQKALEDRRHAETQCAEMYAQYLEVVDLNERLLRTRGTVTRFKARVRRLYERALKGDKNLMAEAHVTRLHLEATERALGDLQIENESLRISLETHQEAQKQIAGQLQFSFSEIENLKGHLKSITEECENRGILLDEADRKIRGYLAEMNQMGAAIKEGQEKLTQVRDENLLLQNQLRELQLREAGVATLNTELADAMTRAQKQIHELEDRLQMERKQSQARVNFLEQEIQRLRENIHAESLVEKSLQFQSQYTSAGGTQASDDPVAGMSITAGPSPASTGPAPKATSAPPKAAVPKKQWNEFYNRWSHIIDELSSHSKPIMKENPSPLSKSQNEELISEGGEIGL